MKKQAAILGAGLIIAAALSYAQAPVPLVNLPLVPDATTPGGPQFTLTVNGTGFVANSVVNWNGTPLATQFVSRSQLTATVPASYIARPGSGQVTVVSPGPGGGASTPLPFEITKGISVFTFSRSDYGAGYGFPSTVAADFNRDGSLDAAGVSGAGIVSVFLGDGHGKFRHYGDYPAGSLSGNDNDSLVVGDFNGDGIPDLAVRGGAVLIGNGDGSFQAPLPYPVSCNGAIAVGDFNGDGKLDVACIDNSSNVVYILLGNGDGTLQDAASYVTSFSPYGVAVGDFNLDGKLDLAVALGGSNYGGQNAVAILLGNGDGTFQPPVNYATAGESYYVYAADLNGDGVLDLVAPVQSSPQVSVLLGNGDGTFQSHVDYPAGTDVWRGGVADINGDGKLDVIVTGWYTDNSVFSVLLGNGDGTLREPLIYALAGPCPLGTSFGDFNRDGMLDIVIGEQCGTTISVMLGAAVGIVPDSLAFGNVPAGKQSSLAAQLTNIQKSTLNIKGITIGGSGTFSQTNNCGNSLEAGQSCTVTVTFAPTTTGSFGGEVLITDNVLGSPQRVFLSGQGSSAALATKR